MPPANKSQKKTVPLAKFDPDKLEEFLEDAARSHPDNEMLLKAVNDKVKEHGGVHGLLGSMTSSTNEVQKFAGHLVHTFPFEGANGTAIQGPVWADGLGIFHLFQLGFDESSDGYSIPSSDEYLAMMCLILARGFQTDPAVTGE